MQRLQEQAVLSSGKKIDYALGVDIGKYRGLNIISHEGGDAGYCSYVTWFADYQLGVVVLSNLGDFNPAGTANKVAAVFLGDKMEPEKDEAKIEHKFIALDPAKLERYPGEYRLDIGITLQVFKKGSQLYAKAPVDERDLELKPLAPDKFLFEPADIAFNFVPDDDGRISLDVVQNGHTTMHSKPVIPVKLTPEDLSIYAGRYWSEELETQYTLFVRDGKLLAGNAHHIEIPLMPAGTDETFQGSQWFFQKATFARNSAGAVTAMTVGGFRTKGIRFERR